ncbi:MAG: sensor histidine kinase [Rhodothalassiaceae bacterium]
METVGHLADPVTPVTPSTAAQQVLHRFLSDDALAVVPVVDAGVPVGLVARPALMLKFAEHFGRELYGRKPIAELMDRDALVVEAVIDVERLNQVIVEQHPRALSTGFMVVAAGRYIGVASGLALLQANMRLAAIRSEELDRARIEAETASRSKAMFLANMSHELRTPLNAIIGFTDFICEGSLGPIQPAKYQEYIRDVNESGKHLLNVINAILDMSKIEANRLELDEEYCDPVELVEIVVRIMRGMADRAGVILHNALSEDLPNLYVDMQLFRQILMNLISNAVKFSDPGSPVHVEGWIEEDGAFVIAVRDEGCGIAPKDMDRVMMPFGQADVSLGRSKQGTGLGLPLVKALSEAHGGTFRLESVLGQGTTAIVRFPGERILRDRPSSLQTLP